eukprot:TRINITY_DN70440_c0_g1_i1.p1 TRINITY_DN70440_c0_g1~~TRINITY_DN70440_c0_g1_i1.p1  ORF type:complete len:119 (+),score=25.54 TRINITY_DN70440_c0_g1_i1:125-481(+)
MCIRDRKKPASRIMHPECGLGCGGGNAIEESKEVELDVNAITLSELQQFNSNLLDLDSDPNFAPEQSLSNFFGMKPAPVSYTHLRAHETSLHLVCRLLLEKKKITRHISNTNHVPQKS